MKRLRLLDDRVKQKAEANLDELGGFVAKDLGNLPPKDAHFITFYQIFMGKRMEHDEPVGLWMIWVG